MWRYVFINTSQVGKLNSLPTTKKHLHSIYETLGRDYLYNISSAFCYVKINEFFM